MKKILFDNHLGLTKAVLEGRKTMTRRIISNVIITQTLNKIDEDGDIGGADTRIIIDRFSRYKVGEVVAVAQSYKDCGHDLFINQPGWTNKMFVRADLMPHQIRITNVRVERLQDISDEDCLREGIYKQEARHGVPALYAFETCEDQYGDILAKRWYVSPREAFAALIDKVSGKGTFESNPLVFVYVFELVK